MFASAPHVLAGFVERGRLAHHQFGGAHADIGARAMETGRPGFGRSAGRTRPLAGIGRGLADEPFGVADAFGADQNALGIHAG